MLNIEHRLMSQMASPCDYDSLTVMQKVEVFRTALHRTAGIDLARVLWLKSKSSEVWLERRTNYTRSLAVMSMVGYILGLGDRHPSNLMLDRFTGKILHIDFGDCFEVAMHRGKFPEKIPFRLTRMLFNAMEVRSLPPIPDLFLPLLPQVSGIEGTYRTTCEQVMEVLQEARDSLVAMLGAFVHDPLISWRLLGTQAQQDKEEQQQQAQQKRQEQKELQQQQARYHQLQEEQRQAKMALNNGKNVQAAAANPQQEKQAQNPPPTPRLGPV
ncbi:unnamed protein product, partial [Choristocarpus tenellus]